MAFSIVQQKIGAWTSGTTFSITLDAAPTAGNRLVLLFSSTSPLAAHQIASISGGGGAWTVTSASHAGRDAEIWTSAAVSGVLSAVVIQLGGTGGTSDTATLVEVAGTVDTVLSGTGQTATSTTPTTPDLTPPVGHEAILFGVTRAGAAVSGGPSDSFNALTSSDGSSRSFMAYRVISAPSGAYHTTWTSASGAWEAAIGGLSAPATLTFSTQPSNVTSGVANSPSIVVTSSDTTFTGTVTLTKASGTGSVTSGGSVSAVAGVATFPAFIVSGSGAWTLSAAATGHTSLTSSSFTVSAATGSTPPTTSITSPATGGSIVYGTTTSFTGTASDPDVGDTIASYRWSSSIDGAIAATQNPTGIVLTVGTHTISFYATDNHGNETASPDTITRTVTSYPLAIDSATTPLELITNGTAFTVDVAAPNGVTVTVAKGATSIVVSGQPHNGTISSLNPGTLTGGGAGSVSGAVRSGYARFTLTMTNGTPNTNTSSAAHNLVFSTTNPNCTGVTSYFFWPAPTVAAITAALPNAGGAGVPGGIWTLTSMYWNGDWTGNGGTAADWGFPVYTFTPLNGSASGGTNRRLRVYHSGAGSGGTFGGRDSLGNAGLTSTPISPSVIANGTFCQHITTDKTDVTKAYYYVVAAQTASTADEIKAGLIQFYDRLFPWLLARFSVDRYAYVPQGYSAGGAMLTNLFDWLLDSAVYKPAALVLNDATWALSALSRWVGLSTVTTQDDVEATWAARAIAANTPILIMHGGLSDRQNVGSGNNSGNADGTNAFVQNSWWGSSAGYFNNLSAFHYKTPGGTIKTIPERSAWVKLESPAGANDVTSATSSKYAVLYWTTNPATFPDAGNDNTTFAGMTPAWLTNGNAGYTSRLAAFAALKAGISVPSGEVLTGACIPQLNTSNGGTFSPGTNILNGLSTPGVTSADWVLAGPNSTTGPQFQTYGQIGYQIAGTLYVLPEQTLLVTAAAPGTLAGGGAKSIAASQYASVAFYANAAGAITAVWGADAASEDAAHRAIASAATPASTAYICSMTVKASASGWTPGTDCFTGGSGTKPATSWRTYCSRGVVNHFTRLGATLEIAPNATSAPYTVAVAPTSRLGYGVTGVTNVSGTDHSGEELALDPDNTGLQAWVDNWLAAAAATGGTPGDARSTRRRRFAALLG